MKTAVEYLFETLWDCPKDKLTWYSILEKANKMFEQQIIDAHNDGYESISGQAEQYYNETYGSNGSDELKKAEEMGLYDKIELANPNDSISSQTEISDEEIQKAAESQATFAPSFVRGVEWYREQLKKKQ